MGRVYHTDVSTSTLVFDEDRYLVEMYFMHPNIEVVPHSHPFDSVTIFMGGHLLGRRESILGGWLNSFHTGLVGEVLPAGQWHAFQTGKDGATVFVVSSWEDIAEKNSATVKYLGTPLGPIHAQSLLNSVV